MAGRYRALLIGNSTYPADEHNLQTLKGPVKDIAVLNRALSDRDTGLFADVDVTLLPESTSTRAVRALGTFFTTADRDDVLLVYFSGHGKLDQMGRLHLCMNDTETTDLLSTAVSSVRINEFADASRARNVVIILDCCYSGAFRGGEFGDTVAGPGRYVMTTAYGNGCSITLKNTTSGDPIPLPGNEYSVAQYQINQTGSFQWQSSDRQCLITPFAGSGTAVLPFTWEQNGDTDTFTAPARGVVVEVKDPKGGSNCTLRLFDPANRQELDVNKWSTGMGPVTLNPNGRTHLYIFDDGCVIGVSAHT
jgi:hypothetical protein